MRSEYSRQLFEDLDVTKTVKGNKLQLKTLYTSMQEDVGKPSWRALMFGNMARPRSVFLLWLACNGMLATKDHLKKIGMIQDDRCAFCVQQESLDHLFFCCTNLKSIWEAVLSWLNINHVPLDWERELRWLTLNCKGRSWRAKFLKCAIAESVYEVWK
ncbi:uncharacterized protein LOC131618845 [Vicia villosa]|uniref:uncharacterized protein LOC131618845 n=1 Tax=Vicia villosa TaxID=3911 RepID=UPI00273BB0DF|nr:uncharacterized protein LOC131618845 [Vicia villosa]